MEVIFHLIIYLECSKINFLIISHTFLMCLSLHMLSSSTGLGAAKPSTNKLFLGFYFRNQLKVSTYFLPLHWEFYLQLLGLGILKVWSMIIQGEGTWDNWRKTDFVEGSFMQACVCKLSGSALLTVFKGHVLLNMWWMIQLALQQERCYS